MDKAEIEFEAQSEADVYRIANKIAMYFPQIKIVRISFRGKNWIFEKQEKLKYLFKNNYFDAEANKAVKMKEIRQKFGRQMTK